MSRYSIGFIKAFEQAMASNGRPTPVDLVEGGYPFIVPPDNVSHLEGNVERQRVAGCVVDLPAPQALSDGPRVERQVSRRRESDYEIHDVNIPAKTDTTKATTTLVRTNSRS